MRLFCKSRIEICIDTLAVVRYGDHVAVAARRSSGRAMMSIKELDRLVSKTNMNEASKKALKHVRTAVLCGKCGSPNLASDRWSVTLENEYGFPMRLSFSFKKEIANVE